MEFAIKCFAFGVAIGLLAILFHIDLHIVEYHPGPKYWISCTGEKAPIPAADVSTKDGFMTILLPDGESITTNKPCTIFKK